MSQLRERLRRIEAAAHCFEDDGAIPNHPELPLLIYAGVLPLSDRDPALVCEKLFAANGWTGAWRNGIYSFAHYHSTAHEVLGVCRGRAEVRLGGKGGVIVTVQPGDVLVLPAGTGHQNLGSSPDLLIVGAYPDGQSWDLCYGRPDERPRVLQNIARVPLPAADPVYGKNGPLTTHWLKRA